MISYEPLWQTMARLGATTYTLQVKGQISSSTIRRLKTGQSVSTNTIDALCKLLECSLTDVLAFLPDDDSPWAKSSGGFCSVGQNASVGVGAHDDPTAKRQFSEVTEKCCAFSGGTSRTPSPTFRVQLFNVKKLLRFPPLSS